MSKKYCIIYKNAVVREIVALSPAAKVPQVVTNKLQARAAESLNNPNINLGIIDWPGYEIALSITLPDGSEIMADGKLNGNLMISHLELALNKQGERSDFGLVEIGKKAAAVATSNKPRPTPAATQDYIEVIDTNELAIMDEFGEKIEALGAMMPPELRPILIRYVETSVDTSNFSYAQKLAVANNIFTTRTRIGHDGFYYFVSNENLRMSWGYGLLNKIARYMDKINGGSGHVEFIEEIPTADEIKKYGGGGTLVKLRMLSSSARKNHHEIVKQYQETFRTFVAITGNIETAKSMTDELYPHVKNQAGVVGYGSAKSAPHGWTLHDQATKLCMKNLIKRNFNMPGRNDWALITGGEIGNMNDDEYAKFLLENEEFLGYRKLGNSELNKIAASQKNAKDSETDYGEHQANIELMRGPEHDG
jgi:hypothetical protein